ncbi:MAG: cytochrome P450 [Myxococcota bacterium]
MTLPNLGDPEILSDPYPAYRRAFATGPLLRSPEPESRTWFLGGHEEISSLLRDPTLSSNRVAFLAHRLTPPQRQAIDPLLTALSEWILFKDPPAHTPLRRSVNAALSRRLVIGMQASIGQLVGELLDLAAARSSLDIVADLANPLPAIVVARMLGARPEDCARLKAWSEDIAQFLGARTGLRGVQDAQRSTLAMIDYFRDVLARHRAEPRDDLMGALLAAFPSNDPKGDEGDHALLANCVALMFAGHETTTNLIGNAVHLLLDRPALVDRLRQDPPAWARAIEEVLRYESPVQRVSRVTTVPREIAGVTIPAGHRVIHVLAAANRDPAIFDQPERFEIDRSPNPHLTFGFGIHLCSGAALARIEARAALQALFERFEGLERQRPVSWKPNFGFRSLTSLPVSWTHAR